MRLGQGDETSQVREDDRGVDLVHTTSIAPYQMSTGIPGGTCSTQPVTRCRGRALAATRWEDTRCGWLTGGPCPAGPAAVTVQEHALSRKTTNPSRYSGFADLATCESFSQNRFR